MARSFSIKDGYSPVDFVQCGLDHLTASKRLFESTPDHYDSAGYLAHIGLELLLKAWLLEAAGEFEGTHKLNDLYLKLACNYGAPALDDSQKEIMHTLDQFEQLRYPNPSNPIEVGDEDFEAIEALASIFCQNMPNQIRQGLEKSSAMRKAGRVLMKRKASQA